MAIINIWIFPLLISLYSIVCLLVCDFTKYIPAKNAYTIMTNHILLLLSVWMYLKYRELKSFYRQAEVSNSYIKLSRVNLFIGIAALTCYQLAVNFPATKINHVALVCNKLALLLANLYIWFHAFLSLKIRDSNVPRWILFLIRITLAFVVFSLAAAMIQANWVPDPAKQYVAIDAIYEWCCYFAFSVFLLTDSYEFRFLVFKPPKLIIRGCVGYNERVFESSDVSEDEDALPPLSQTYVN
ncbi:hypothetical protein CAEBREN_17297 [Caenorhabditis brenneri]|uniref:CWH43-like N-terminal domain-containing protein n=1 Tax=Caenorhabditis brenneri TaxID=135651 RepID=G0MPR1_CAEBE|nr:hypothetical protein CAEBREN_17297 [Caenorhabditis brenneri]